MVRYEHDDSDSNRTLLIGTAVVAGLLAGGMLAHRYGGTKGLRRALSRRRGPLLAALRAAIPSRSFAVLLELIGADELLDRLFDTPRRSRKLRSRRRPDPDLDEYEVDDFERASSGVDDDDYADEYEDSYTDEYDDEDDDDLDAPAAQLRRFRHASARDLEEDEELDDDEDFDEEEAIVDEDEEGEDAEEEEEEALTDDLVEAYDPAQVEAAVLEAFGRHPILRQRALQISVDDEGVVELTGWVRRERDIRTARRVAGRVDGVERVVIDISVRDGAPLVSSAHADES